MPAEVQALVREKQQQRKHLKRKAKKAGSDLAVAAAEPAAVTSASAGPARGGAAAPQEATPAAADYPSRITSAEYFASSGLFRDPNLPATEGSLELLLAALGAGDQQARRLGRCNYFQFCGPERSLWDPVFNARLAYEGFFTITTSRHGATEPLPELQPFYGVLTWPNFEASKHVRKALARVGHSGRRFRLVDCSEPRPSWKRLDAYHCQKYGCNWLTERYFDMILSGSKDASVNFTTHCIELFEEGASEPLAGEIGFSIGRVYTSLSGWTGERSSDSLGTTQLVLLGRWLQQSGYVFWSLGHCYSPEMDYKRELGHRVYPRADFLSLLHKHRGCFRTQPPKEVVDGTFRPLKAGDEREAGVLLEVPRQAPTLLP